MFVNDKKKKGGMLIQPRRNKSIVLVPERQSAGVEVKTAPERGFILTPILTDIEVKTGL